jgi:PAS domain S-box-containing protein
MLRFKLAKDSLNTSEGIFALMLLAIFGTELAINYLLYSLFVRLDLFYASLLDASILVLLYAVPLWFFVMRPLSGKKAPELKTHRVLFMAVLAGIFLAEFLIMMGLPYIMTQSDNQSINLVDAFFTTLLCAPGLWWLTCSRKNRSSKIPADDMLSAPLRLFCLLLFTIFLTDLLMDILSAYLLPDVSHTSTIVIDSFLATLIIAPLIWWFLVKPLLMNSQTLKARVMAIYSQAVDAILTIDSHGVIDSVNPAAERIFGYDAEELIGKKGAQLFDESVLSLDDLIHGTDHSGTDDGKSISYEVSGRCRDGLTVTMAVSISRILFEGQPEYLVIIHDISERKKMEKELKESEERLSLAFVGANDGVWDWDLLTDTVYYSPRLKELLGYRSDELENTYQSFTASLHPEDHGRVIEAIRNHLEGNLPYDIQYRLRTKVGNYRWYRARGQVARDAAGRAVRMAGSLSDINTQREAVEALRESEVRFRQIFEQSEDAIMFFKPQTCSILDVNGTAEKLYGYTKSELQEGGLNLLTRPEDFSLLANAIRNIGTDKVTQLEKIVNICKDGSEIFVSMRGKVMTLQGVDIIYCTFRDVTERLQMEIEARNIQSKLIQANKMTSLGLLVSGVAHEINNPNNFIMANSQLLERSWADALKILHEYYLENGEFYVGGIPFSELEAHSPKLFAGITDGSRRIESIINNLKNFARKDGSIDKIDVDVNQVATSAVSILHYELNKFTEKFHLELAENIPLVKGSSQQLGQIIINLLMNACQALPSRQCGIWLATSFDAAAGQVIISVRDEGHGMSPEKSRMIMEPFFTTKLDSGGTGLGLSICQSITKDHSWCMEFTSEPGKGSTFYLKIPVSATAAKEHSL